MKKLLTLLMALFMVFGVVACENVTEEKVTLMAPDGAPGIVIAKIASEGKVYDKTVETTIVNGASEITVNVMNGSAQMAVMPLNLAAKLYNKGAKIKLVSVNVFGSLYMVGKSQITSLNDLVGKVVYNIGEGGTPDLTLKYILEQNNIEYTTESEVAVPGKVALCYVTAANELIVKFKSNQADFGILGEPAVTNCNAKAGTTTVLSIQDEWKKVTGEEYTQAGFVVNEELSKNNVFMSVLCDTLEDNYSWTVDNVENLKNVLMGKGSSLEMDYTAELIERCRVGYKTASLAKGAVESYFNVLLGFDATLIGGKLPDNGFYYGYTEIAE